MTTKVRVCGDSIGAGFPHYTGYRSRLARAMGGAFSWTGSQTTEWVPGKGYVPQPGTTLRHECHGGIGIEQFRNSLPVFLRATSLVDDLFLVQLGVNDYSKMNARQIVDALEKLVDEMRARSPSTEILIMPPTPALPRESFGAKSAEVERLLKEEVPTWNTYYQARAFTSPLTQFRAHFEHDWKSVLISDGTHLTDFGFEILADDLTVALGKAPLPRETPPPVVASTIEPPPEPEREAHAEIVSDWSRVSGPLAWHEGAEAETYVTDPEGDLYLPTLNETDRAAFESRVRRWTPLADEFSKKYGVPVAWILGVIFAESGGDPRKKNAENPPGLGLMQITHPSLKVGHSDQEFLDDPRLNVEVGTKTLATLIHALGPRLPEVASGYNAGFDPAKMAPHPSDDPLWRMRNTPGHIGRVVAAANTALGYPPAGEASAPKGVEKDAGPGFGALVAIGAGAVAIGAVLSRR